jgi:hypothetical protein
MGGCLKVVGAGAVGLVALVAVLLVVGGAGSRPTGAAVAATGAPGAAPTASPGVGSVVAGRNWTYLVTGVERPSTVSDNQFLDGRPKGAWVAVYVTLQNTGKENFPINVHDFELHDAGGVKYRASAEMAAIGYPRAKGLAPLGGQSPPGVPVKSVVLFDVAPSAAGLRLWLVQEKVYVDLGQ